MLLFKFSNIRNIKFVKGLCRDEVCVIHIGHTVTIFIEFTFIYTKSGKGNNYINPS